MLAFVLVRVNPVDAQNKLVVQGRKYYTLVSIELPYVLITRKLFLEKGLCNTYLRVKMWIKKSLCNSKTEGRIQSDLKNGK